MATTDSDSKIVRDKAFAQRLNLACENNPNCPTTQHRGKQKWLYDQLWEKFKIRVTAEGARKWFAGEAKPRPPTLSAIAQLLEVDEAWLSMGAKPDMPMGEKRVRDAKVSGVVNLVAGLMQMAGNTIAFPEGKAADLVDLFTIADGEQHSIKVALALARGVGAFRFTVPAENDDLTIIGVIEDGGPLNFQVLRLPADIIEAHGERRGDYMELQVKQSGNGYFAGTTPIPVITNFQNLDGEIRRHAVLK